MFGSKRALFCAVVGANFDRLESLFTAAAPAHQRSELVALGDAYRRLLRRDRAVALLMLQIYAVAGDEVVREVLSRRHLLRLADEAATATRPVT